MSRKTWSAVDDYIAESLLPADPVARSCAGAQQRQRPAGHRRVAGARQAAASAGPHERRQDDPRDRNARRLFDDLAGARAAARRQGRDAGARPAPCRGGAHQSRKGRAVRSGRPARRAGAGIAVGAECRGRGAVRLHLHRRRQAEQPALSVLGDAAVAAGHGHRLRQRRSATARCSNEDGRDANVEGARAAFSFIGGEKRLDGTAIQTVGAKGYDGFAIAIVG